MGVRGARREDRTGEKPLLNDVHDLLQIASTYGYFDGSQTNVLEIARHLSLVVRSEPMSSEISGKLRKEGDQWVAVVNSHHHRNRQRFTIAHEIAHFIMHRRMHDSFEDKTFFRKSADSGMEYAANAFAAALLMPEGAFRELISAGNNKVEDLAKHFGVSTLAVRFRAQQLGYMGSHSNEK